MSNSFIELAAIDCKEHIEKKGQFSYLSWAWAVDTLRRARPDATWEVKRFDGLPYLKSECGFFVEVAVTVDNITLSHIHPVLSHQNKPIPQPNSFDINTSIARCLVKAIAMHGLGLYIYSGEDLPPDGRDEKELIDNTKKPDMDKIDKAVADAVKLVDADGEGEGGMEASKLQAHAIVLSLTNDEKVAFQDKLKAMPAGKTSYAGLFKRHYTYEAVAE